MDVPVHSEVREAAEEGCAGVLRWSRPAGEVEGRGGMGVGSLVGGVLLTEFAIDDRAHGGLFGWEGPLPIEAEALVADAALDVLLVV